MVIKGHLTSSGDLTQLTSYAQGVTLVNLAFFTQLKGLGHAILGIFGTDRMVIELTKILK